VENVIGIALALQSLSDKLSPSPILSFNYFTTIKFKYSIFKVFTGLKFILITSVDENDYVKVLENIYKQAYLEFVKKNILYKANTEIENPAFKKACEDIFKNLIK